MTMATKSAPHPPDGGDTAPRLLDLAYRCATDESRDDLPWHLLSMQAQRVVGEQGRLDDLPPARATAQRIAFGVAVALAGRLSGLGPSAMAERLVPWLRPLWRLDRLYGINVLGRLGESLEPLSAGVVREISGAALLRMLARRERSDGREPLSERGLCRELTALGAIPLFHDTNASADWALLAHGVYRHVTELACGDGPAAVAQWVRLCPSRTALGYVAGLDVIRNDAVLVGTLLLHGGPREIAVGLTALHSAGAGSPVRSALAGLILRDESVSSLRLSYLFDRLADLSGPEPELRDALLARAGQERPSAVEPPYTDELLLSLPTGHVEAAMIESGRFSPATILPLSRRLVTVAEAVLTAWTASNEICPDERWALASARGLAAGWRVLDTESRAELRSEVVRALARVEAELNRLQGRPSGDTLDPHATARTRTRALATLAVQLARSLPRDERGASFAIALYELALRLRQRHPAHLADVALFSALEPMLAHAPDTLDPAQVEELGDFLRNWRARELGEGLALPQPESTPVVDGHALGVAVLPDDEAAA